MLHTKEYIQFSAPVRNVRSFSLPQSIDTENISADYKNGILTLQMVKRAEAKPKQIKVNIGSQLLEAKKSNSTAA